MGSRDGMVIDDTTAMRAAMTAAAAVRTSTSPNPWVGAVVVTADGIVGTGATEPPGGRHAEIVALAEAGAAARDATVVCTLEPCSHHGRTPPCTDALIAARGGRVGVLTDEVTRQLAAYLHHRRTGRPYVVCKLAMSLDGGTAAPDGSSQWITGIDARRDAHVLRAESDAIAVGAGTVRADDPALTVRHVEGTDPLRVVLGSAPAGARVHPCVEWHGDLDDLLDDLGRRGVVQLMVEGGATVIGSFHRAGLVDRYVLYVAPALFGGRDSLPAIGGATAATITDVWRGRFESVEQLGADLRIEIVPHEERT